MKYGPIFSATQRDGAIFPHFFVTRRSQTPGMLPSSFLDVRNNGSRRGPPVYVDTS